MRSAHDAATLLRAARHPDGLRALARALHFPTPRPVPAHTAARLGVPRFARAVERATRPDGCAILLLHAVPADRWRDCVIAAARTLDRTHDPRRWLLLAATHDAARTVVATWLAADRAPRIAALVTEHAAPVEGDAVLLAALAATLATPTDPHLAALRWHDILGRTATGRRVFGALERAVTGIAGGWHGRLADDDRRTLAITVTARFLFLKFLEAKGWLDGDRDFLARHATRTLERGRPLWQGLACPLTFGTLNTPPLRRAATARAFGAVPFLNGGLFARTALEDACGRPRCDDAPLATLLLDVLARHRFTAREDAHTWSEAAVDPELLGRTFEALMHPDRRRGTGTFYTPAPLARTLVHDALAHALAHAGDRTAAHDLDTTRAALAGTAPPREARTLRDRAARLRILDPACGSGALLVTALDALTTLRLACGDPRRPCEVRREVLARSIFGVDVAPLAVWLTELRCWLALVIDDDTADPHAVAPLPNLDHHVRAGDSLAAPPFGDHADAIGLATLRTRYAHATGQRKRALARTLDAHERRLALAHADARLATLDHERRELLHAARARTLFGTRTGLSTARRHALATCKRAIADARRHRRALATGAPLPFAFATHFGDAARAGGFDVVVGNPPWIRPHHADAALRDTLRTRFAHLARTHDRAAFGAQVDTAAAFTDRALALTRPGGITALVLPAKLFRSRAGGALRAHVLAHATPLAITDQGDDPLGFEASVYPATLVTRRHAAPHARPAHAPTPDDAMPTIAAAARDAAGTLRTFELPLHRLGATDAPHAPWRLAPPEVRAAADTLVTHAIRWHDTPLPPPTLGVKTGHNAAFVLDARDTPHDLRPHARPALRGDAVTPWRHTPDGSLLLVPHDDDGAPLRTLPAPAARHLAPFTHALRARTDLRPRDAWWTLFRTDLLARGGWRVAWADVGRSLRATLLPPQSPTVPLNSCYGVRCTDPIDAHALLALLNAPTTTALLALVAEPARGGFHRFLGFTVASLPLPPWHRARELLAPLAARARRGTPPDARTLHDATLAAYGVRHDDVAPLLAWTGTLAALGDAPPGTRRDARHATRAATPRTAHAS